MMENGWIDANKMKIGTKIGLITTVLFTFPLLLNWPALEVLRLKTFDALIPAQTTSGHFVILDITEEDVAREGGWPFPRQRLASLQDELISRGALGVGWVVLFPQPDRFGGDGAFATSLQSGINVLAMPEFNNGQYPAVHGTVLLGEDPAVYTNSLGFLQNVDQLSQSAYQGAVSAPTDVDNLIRRIPLIVRVPDGWVASFATQVLKALTGEGTYQIRTNQTGIESIRIPELGVIPTDIFGRKWISWINTPRTTLQDPQVEGKFVFVGVTAAGVMSQLATPVGLLNPHHIQAALAESLLLANSPQVPANRLLYELGILLLVCAVIIFTLQWGGVLWSAVSVGGVLAGTVAVGVLFIRNNQLIDVTWSCVCLLLLSGEQFWFNFREQYLLRQQIKKQFEHYLDPRQVKQLQDNPTLLKLGGETRYATFLFTDLRGFTSLSERLSPEEVTEIMNKTLSVQVQAIQQHGGMVDKFIGDACMGIFSAPLDLPHHETAAVKAAIEIQENIKALNKTLLVPVAIGVGVNSGKAVIGNMGSASRFDYTAIGDAVNTAARLESATKQVGVEILVGATTAKKCDFMLKSLDPIEVKGKKDPLQVFTVEKAPSKGIKQDEE
jgi:adenylate cyclase